MEKKTMAKVLFILEIAVLIGLVVVAYNIIAWHLQHPKPKDSNIITPTGNVIIPSNTSFAVP